MRDLADINRDMHDYLPRYYEDATTPVNAINREAEEVASLNAAIYDVLAQLYIPTATWSLARWEAVFGIPTDEAKPIEQRRSVIMSRLRGIGTVTVSLIENVAEAYANGDVSVTEDNATGTVIITFISNLGIPANMTDIQTALRDIIPAHLAIEYRFTYMTWGDLDSYSLTWADVDALGLTWAEWERYKP